jgi:hypothetical protein
MLFVVMNKKNSNQEEKKEEKEFNIIQTKKTYIQNKKEIKEMQDINFRCMILIDRNEKKMEEKKNQNECYEKQVD